MQFPKINMNGTDGSNLLQQYLTALSSVQSAIHAVRAIEVHGRDYQTINSDAASVAMHEHRVRLGKLDGIRDDLERIAVDIQDQIAERTV